MMKIRRWIWALLVCAAMLGGMIPSAMAAQPSGGGTVRLEDLEWEWIDLSAVECPEGGVMPRTRVSADGAYSGNSVSALTQFAFLPARKTVTFNCSYSPSSASMDFGVITSDGRFYSIKGEEGSINKTLEISQAGSYAVAIRNNSSQTVSVAGFVDY